MPNKQVLTNFKTSLPFLKYYVIGRCGKTASLIRTVFWPKRDWLEVFDWLR